MKKETIITRQGITTVVVDHYKERRVTFYVAAFGAAVFLLFEIYPPVLYLTLVALDASLRTRNGDN